MGKALGITPDFPAVEPTPRWVRVKVGDQIVADSRRALLYRQYGPAPMLPTYYLPVSDVVEGLLTDPRRRDDGSVLYAVETGGKRVEGAAWTCHSPTGDFAALEDMVTFTWADDEVTWLEEDEESSSRTPGTRTSGSTWSTAPGTCRCGSTESPSPTAGGPWCSSRRICRRQRVEVVVDGESEERQASPFG